MKLDSLNIKQKLFVQYYLQSMNATQALIKAGYKKKGARSYAVQLLAKPFIQDYINKTKQKIELTTIVTFERKLNLLWSIANDEKVETDNKIKAIEVMNKMQGHNAPDRVVNYNADISEQMKQAREKYLIQDSRTRAIELQASETIVEPMQANEVIEHDSVESDSAGDNDSNNSVDTLPV